jgi:uncharacterized membrane protein
MTTEWLMLDVVEPLVILVAAWALPTITRPTLPFGVRVPAARAAEPVIDAQRRAYRWWVVITGGLVLLAGAVVAALTGFPAAGSLVSVVVLLACVPGYLRARQAILAAKHREDWYRDLHEGVAVDTSLRTEPQHFPWLWTLPALLLLAGTVVLGVLRYPSLPASLAVHFNAHGDPDRVVAKSVGSAFATVFIQAGVTALIVVITALSLRARPDLDAAAPRRTARQHRVFTARTVRAVLLLTALLNLSMLIIAWQVWSGGAHLAVVPVLLPVLAGVVVLLAVGLRVGQLGSRVPAGDGDEDTGVVQRDDDRYWRGGVFYVNRNDPSVIVPKRLGYGWTLNFGNPRALWLLLPVVVLAVVVRLVVR